MTTRRLAAVLFAVAALCASAAFAGQAVTFLFFNDFHAHFEPFTVSGSDEMVGGAARLAGLADRVRASNAAAGVPTFLLVAGDAFSGTPFSSMYRGQMEFAFLNAVRVDAMCLGNHEFDYGADRLRDLLPMAEFPVLAANVTPAVMDEWTTFAGETAWLDAGAKKVLVIGLTTPDTPVTTAPRNVAGLAFHDPTEVAARLAERYKGEADLVVALTHLGFDADLALAKAVPALDVVVGGHTHTKVTEPARAGNAVVVSDYEYGEFLGRLDLDLGDDGVVAVTGYELIPVTAAAPEDAAVAAIVAKGKEGLDAALKKVVGRTDTVLVADGVREGETNFGDWLADLVREAGDADVGLVNAGSIRGSLGPGDITLADVMTALPFDNEVVTVELTGAALRQAIAFSAGDKWGAGGFLQVSGCEVEIEPRIGVSDVTVGGKALDDDATYKVAVPGFLAEGGDGYTMIAAGANITKTGVTFHDVLTAALAEGRAVPAETAGRIKVAAE